MAVSAIERFITGYLRNKKISEPKKGYADWLRKNGLDPTAELSEKIDAASTEYAKASSEYGSNAEALAEGGLLRSGYENFLKGELEREKNDGFEAAALGYIKQDIKNEEGYEKELEDIRLKEEKRAEEERLKADKEAKDAAIKASKEAKKLEEDRLKKEKEHKEKIYNTTKDDLEKRKIINYDKAYEYAKNMGLDETNAAHLAKTVTENNRSDAIYKVTNAIFDKTLTMNQAKKYAENLRLGEEDVKALAELAFLVNESAEDISSYEDYLDYLRDKDKAN